MIQPFSVNIPQPVLDDLQHRLLNTRWPAPDYYHLQPLIHHWAHHFDWRKWEAKINAFPNYLTAIEEYNIHFIHIPSTNPAAIPIIITHGWPGSFLEMLDLIPLLKDDFHIVIPSLPGFGFSGTETCNSAIVATLWLQLMHRLGYTRFAAQGGDIGAGVSTWLALQFPANIIGVHLNYIPGSFKPYQPEITAEITTYQQYAASWAAREGAYAMLQSTKPATLAYGLHDSPTGLAAWIVEKFNTWSDIPFNEDQLLANVTLYWVTGTIYSSFRIYEENSKKPLHFGEHDFVHPPVGFAKFPKEIPTPPQSYIAQGYNLQHWTNMPAGGHFAAWEQPHLLADDMQLFFKKLVQTPSQNHPH